ncbi:hypothetical protein SAMN05216241_10696 [Limimonas halophila]|uniref:Uncharacterized protein n=1 Tax=Limimonas halophila TaxID=1082479 RepID=A0A1G7S2E2_9PROT|nr:hypothetical protein [Limimonas halophila]SDG17182.1 hypothetical protein SAMN05216241_10696 [Limimonas halophila]
MRRSVRIAVGAIVAASLGFVAPLGAAAQDSPVRIEQVPKERQLDQDALDEGLLEEHIEAGRIPERCEDPDVAASDPACVPERKKSVSESYGIPVIEDPGTDNSDLIPGVTINQSRTPSR